jgi:hypothetical protein
MVCQVLAARAQLERTMLANLPVNAVVVSVLGETRSAAGR